jgi:transposase
MARPTLCLRGLLGVTEPILITGGRAVEHSTRAFVGIDVAKIRNAIAVAKGGREREVRYIGEVDASDESMRPVVKQIIGKNDDVVFCHEAGPTGYGLHRLITS